MSPPWHRRVVTLISCVVLSSAGPTSSAADDGGGREHAFGVSCDPRHIHLSVGRHQNSTHSSATVSFSFLPACIARYGGTAAGAVRLGETVESMSHLFIGDADDAQSYNASLTKKQLKHVKDGQTLYFSDVIYHLELDGLKPGTKYYYECLLLEGAKRMPRQNLWQEQSVAYQRNNHFVISSSTRSHFFTPPSPGQWHTPEMGRPIRFAVLGDLGVRPHSRETVGTIERRRRQLLRSGQLDCILLAGDLSYANKDHGVWDDWMDMMSEHGFFRSVPVSIALGNHDLDHDAESLEIGLAYEKRFRMPQARPAVRDLAPNDLFHAGSSGNSYFQARVFQPYEFGNAYYSYVLGPSKHIVLSSYSSFRPGSVQYEVSRPKDPCLHSVPIFLTSLLLHSSTSGSYQSSRLSTDPSLLG